VLVGALLLQIGAVADLRLLEATGDLFLVLTVAAALVDGPDRGLSWGFAGGVLYDLVLDTPFGLSALTYALVGYAVGLVTVALTRPAGWWPVGIAAVAGVLATVVYAGVGHLVGVPYPFAEVPPVALVVAAWNAVLVLPAMRLLRRLAGRQEPDRIALALGGRR
jgi:rod shape-determining protein MreD